MRTSISTTNRVLLGGFITLNLGLIVYMTEYASESRTNFFLLGIMVMNFSMFLLYSVINTRYWSEYDKLFDYFSQFVRNKSDPKEFPIIEEFDENARFLSLFKRTYVEQNLLKKDYHELQSVFEKFIPKNIHDEIGFRGYERIVLGTAVSKTLTIMFLDIVGFTSVSEELHNPYRTLLLLNIYFDGIGEIVYRYGGYIDKYLGDGILIIFDQESSDMAVHAAVEIQEFIKKFQIGVIGRRLRIGIGINTGAVTLGTIGTKRRMEATVIGDAVNIASRLEGLTRTYDAAIIMSDATFRNIQEKEKFLIHFLAEEQLKGRNATVKIYGVDDFENVTLPESETINEC